MSQAEAVARFRTLHEATEPFIIPNPWDVGSAILLAHAGFKALATTSAGVAWSFGKPDGGLSRDDMLAHCRALAAATALPVNGDLENCYAHDAAGVAETIRLAGGTGLAGASIEDASGEAAMPIYDFDHAVARVKAGVEANKALSTPMLITARAENFLNGRKDIADTIKRLQAFEAVGADVLYAPGLATIPDIKAVIGAVKKPVNVLMSSFNADLKFEALAAVGARRISVGGSLARAAYSSMLRDAKAMAEKGDFSYVKAAMTTPQINGIFTAKS